MQPDKIIKWLLESYIKMQNKNIVLVPVNVTYDRLIESANMANQMISGDTRPNGFGEVIYKLTNRLQSLNIGDIFVKYLEPIHLTQYLQERG